MSLGNNRDYKSAERRGLKKLAEHAKLMEELMAHGADRALASRLALDEMEGRKKRVDSLLQIPDRTQPPIDAGLHNINALILEPGESLLDPELEKLCEAFSHNERMWETQYMVAYSLRAFSAEVIKWARTGRTAVTEGPIPVLGDIEREGL